MRRINKIFFAGFISALVVIMTVGPAFSQAAEKSAPQENEGTQQPQPEAPKKLMDVKVENDLVSVELVDADFGSVLNAIAEKSGFKTEITSDVSAKKITTKFSGVDTERGVLRLLTLIKEKNYLLYYDTKGMISKLEVYGSGTPVKSVSKSPATAPARPTVQRRPPWNPSTATPPARPPLPSARPMPARPPIPQTPPAQQQAVKPPVTAAPPAMEMENDDEDEDEVDVPDVPYIAPQRQPVVIPPVRK